MPRSSRTVSRGAWHFDPADLVQESQTLFLVPGLQPWNELHGGSCLPVRQRRQEPRNKNSRFSPRAEDRDLPQDTLNCDQGQIRLDEVQASAMDHVALSIEPDRMRRYNWRINLLFKEFDMTSPFPGMNPWMEAPELWPGVHASHRISRNAGKYWNPIRTLLRLICCAQEIAQSRLHFEIDPAVRVQKMCFFYRTRQVCIDFHIVVAV